MPRSLTSCSASSDATVWREPVNGEAGRYTAGALKLIARLCEDAAQAVFRPGLTAAVGTKCDSVMSRRPHDFPVQVVADRQSYFHAALIGFMLQRRSILAKGHHASGAKRC